LKVERRKRKRKKQGREGRKSHPAASQTDF